MTTLKHSLLLLVGVLIMVMPTMALPQPNIDPDVRNAIRNGDVSYLSNWYKNGGDINDITRNGNTAVFLASRIGDKPTVEFLLSKNPDLNV
ncbi:MAG: ankyrin repeat domain-containing protein [Fodinibius sp.]|nr:ankyrin repeat domain-containing protein [Fodinibius sp.]